MFNLILLWFHVPRVRWRTAYWYISSSISGDFSQRRAVIYTLGFTAKTYLFGPASTQKVIKETQSDIYTDTDTTNKAREERIIVVPNPTSADADDDFGFTTTITNFTDGKKYSTTTDSDE